ncbi:MAG: hypothetical protein EXS35_13520 [Pedosphaera sp.]|nr:hypothetical protein [Pedosphaera sp.]
MTSRFAVLLTIALAIGAAGFLIGRNTAPTKSSAQTAPPPPAAPAKSSAAVRHNAADGEATNRTPFDAADLEAQLKKATSGPWRKRWERMQDLAKTISPANATNALALAEKVLSQNEFWSFRYTLLEKWAESDPQAVLAYGQSLKSRNDRQQAISSALTEWARKDPDAALAWVEKQPRGQERQNFLSAALQGLAETDPQKALDKINSIPMYQRQQIRGQVIDAMAEKDPKAAAVMNGA